MTQILTRLTAFNFLALLTTFTLGIISKVQGGIYDLDSPVFPLHLYMGLFTVLSTLAIHCLIFIYFLGTGRWVKEVALAYGIPDHPLPKQTRELKRQTFPLALLAMLLSIATAAAGAGQRQDWPWIVHATLGVATLLGNLWAFVVEYNSVRANADIIQEVMREVDRIRAERGLPTNAEALQQEQG